MKKRIYCIAVLAAAIGALAVPVSADEIRRLPDGTKYIIHPSQLRSGGPPPDGIPSIDDPVYQSVAEADSWMGDDELVVLIERDGLTRMYPLQILVWHEIVNDVIAGASILVTYCPLCGSAIAFDRVVDGRALEFGTTGKLYNSNLVMYDRATGSYWTQIGGRAIVGELTGRRLTMIPMQTVFWGDWKRLRPDAEVLSRDTGFRRSYGVDPYGSYYSEERLMFPVDSLDDRMHPKTVVYGIEVNGVRKAYREADVLGRGDFTDSVGGRVIEVRVLEGRAVEFVDAKTEELVPFERDFWFAWAAFYPDAGLYDPD